MSIVRQLVKTCLSRCLPPDRFLVQGTMRVREICLTFDDGPHPEWTPRLLDLLGELGIQGTFFVVGERAAEYPQLIRRISDEGHLLGHHSWTHSEPRETSSDVLLAEVRRTRELLENLVGSAPSLFRPPKGALTWSKLRGLWKLRQTIVLWNVDPRDYAMSTPEQMHTWVDQYSPQAGDLLLFHDNHPHCLAGIRALAGREEFRADWRFGSLLDWIQPSQRHRKVSSTTMSAVQKGGDDIHG